MKSVNKLYITSFIIIIILVIGVFYFQYHDSKVIRTQLDIKEARDMQGISPNVSDQGIEDMKELMKEADIICFRLNQRMDEWDKIMDENK